MDQVMNLFIAVADWSVKMFLQLVSWLYHVLVSFANRML
jgi:hypothetical protein